MTHYRMKTLREIIWLTPDLSGLGGSEYLVACFCRLLSAQGLHVHIITRSVHPSWRSVLEAGDGAGEIRILELNTDRVSDFTDAIDSIVQRSTISLMQVMPLESFCFEVIRGKAYHFPICGLEPTDLSHKCWWLPADLGKMIDFLDGLMVLNPNAEATARDKYRFTKPVQVIPNSVMQGLYRNPERRYPPATFGCISRLSAEKGLEYLLGAFSLLSERYASATLSIWGDGEDRERLINLARMLDIHERIRFHGMFHPFHDSLAISASAGIFVLPSLFEGCPTSLLELASRGKPLISSKTSGGKWLLGEDYPGLVPVADTHSLAGMMELTLSDPAFRQQLAVQVLERSGSLFTGLNTGKQLISFYTTLLDQVTIMQ
jgi:glycosyltransferase involved in cell wall biosynthesis